MPEIVIIGAGSYLATGLVELLPSQTVLALRFHEWRNHLSALQSARVIINFAIAPEFSSRDMLPDEVIDVQIAKEIIPYGAQYIYLSSRKVYGSCTQCRTYVETDSLEGHDFYARNKILTEKYLSRLLGDRLTILRISNILGDPIPPPNNGTFMGWITEQYLTKGKLTVNQELSTIKDFITKEYLQKVLCAFLMHPHSGIFNVSSCCSVSLGDLLSLMLNPDELECSSHMIPAEQFLLNNSKMLKITQLGITREDLESQALHFHRLLHQMKAASVPPSSP